MNFKLPDFTNRLITALLFCSVFFGTLLFASANAFTCVLVVLCTLCSYELYSIFTGDKKYLFLILPLYPFLSFLMMIHLNYTHRFLLFLLFLSVFVFDTGAYFIGSMFGKHKLFPSISPAKSWQGVFGGFVLLMLFLKVVLYLNDNTATRYSILIICLSISILSIVGDLFESYLKRLARVKDSSSLLPGHGGFLDRFDAVIFTTPFFYLFRDYLNNIFL